MSTSEIKHKQERKGKQCVFVAMAYSFSQFLTEIFSDTLNNIGFFKLNFLQKRLEWVFNYNPLAYLIILKLSKNKIPL